LSCYRRLIFVLYHGREGRGGSRRRSLSFDGKGEVEVFGNFDQGWRGGGETAPKSVSLYFGEKGKGGGEGFFVKPHHFGNLRFGERGGERP